MCALVCPASRPWFSLGLQKKSLTESQSRNGPGAARCTRNCVRATVLCYAAQCSVVFLSYYILKNSILGCFNLEQRLSYISDLFNRI